MSNIKSTVNDALGIQHRPFNDMYNFSKTMKYIYQIPKSL
jgi:hypothetical protein